MAVPRSAAVADAEGSAAEGDTGGGEAAGRAVLVLAPLGRDAPLLVNVLATAGIDATTVSNAGELVTLVRNEVTSGEPPRLGCLVVADDALAVEWSRRLVDALDHQPSWSDLPVVLLSGSYSKSELRRGALPTTTLVERLTALGSVTVLERPVRMATLVSAVRAALRARGRQAEVRDLIAAHAMAQQEAEQANRAKSEFLAVMSHELRTPLNAIAGYAELMNLGLYGLLTPEQREAVNRITRAQRHLLSLINDLLNYARIEQGRIEYNIELVPLADVVNEVRPMIEPQLARKHLLFEAHWSDPTVVVSADREKLRQVLLNLLSNAVKYTRPGDRITIDVATREDGTQDLDLVYLRVIDTGIGIPDDKLEVIFEPFVQIRPDANAMREGVGLGLAISRDLARGMGGDLRARSALGEGSTFTIVLRRGNK